LSDRDAGDAAIEIRPARPVDAPAIAEVWLRSFGAQFPNINRPHTDDQVRDWIVSELVPTHETWVADAAGSVVGFMALSDDMLDQLYIDVGWQGRGLGDRFVTLAKARRPAGLALYAFQVNERARRFYTRRGFVEVELTDGAGNEEREPDVRLEWRPERDSTPQG
jgi:ribosomal protein S18 acetylase RimI-like enzyme